MFKAGHTGSTAVRSGGQWVCSCSLIVHPVVQSRECNQNYNDYECSLVVLDRRQRERGVRTNLNTDLGQLCQSGHTLFQPTDTQWPSFSSPRWGKVEQTLLITDILSFSAWRTEKAFSHVSQREVTMGHKHHITRVTQLWSLSVWPTWPPPPSSLTTLTQHVLTTVILTDPHRATMDPQNESFCR